MKWNLRIIVSVVLLMSAASQTRADIYEWKWVNPNDHTQGVYQSSWVCPGGSGVSAVPSANLSYRDLTQAYLLWTNLTSANLGSTNLTRANLTNANLTGATVAGANFRYSNLTASQLYSTASYQAQKLQGVGLPGFDLTGWNFAGQNLDYANLSNANLSSGTLTNANLTGASVAGANFGGSNLTVSQLYGTASYQAKNLQGIVFQYNNLTGWNLSGEDLTNAKLTNANLTGGTLTNANLTNANLDSAKLTDANLTGATVAGASFRSDYNLDIITASQLYSTASYQAHDLHGINFDGYYYGPVVGGAGCDLSGWDFSGQNLTNAGFYMASLGNANLAGANLTNANLVDADLNNANLIGTTVAGAIFGSDFSYVPITASQLYSTASYQAHDLHGIQFAGTWLIAPDLSGWDFSGQNLTNAKLIWSGLGSANLTNANLTGADLTNAYLTGADLRGAQGFSGSASTTTNTILPDGTIQGLHLDSNNSTLLVRNYSGSSSIRIRVLQGMSVNPGTSLAFQLDGNPWGSTISFAAGIPVTLGGNVELGLAPGVDPTGQLGQFFQLFNWTGVSPSGQFAQVVSDLPTRYLWNTSALYTFGGVALTLSPTAINGQWATSGGGTWSGTANWTGGNVPGAPQDTAVFGTALSSGTTTVTLDSSVVSLASLAFSTTGGAGYVISPFPSSGASTLILSNTAGSATITSSGGNNTIAVPITLDSNLSVSASTGSALTIAAAISESGGSRSLTLSGGGELILSGSNSYTGGTTVDAGTLIVTNNEALADGTNLTVGADASLIFAPSLGGAPSAASSTSPVPEPSTLVLLVAALWSAVIHYRFPSRRAAKAGPHRRAARLPATAFAAFVAASVLLVAVPLRGANSTWAVSYGDWSSTANWTGNVLPGAADTAYIVNGGTANVTQLGATCGTLSLGSSAGSGSVQMTGGDLTTGDQYVGRSGTGAFTQSGGNNNITYFRDLFDYSCSLYLGYNAASTGTYNLSGTGNVTAGYEYLGSYGTGTFTQTGGLNCVCSILVLAPGTGGSGTYNLSGSGQVWANGEEVAPVGGTATFTQSGGTNSTGEVVLSGTGNSAYNLSGGQLSAVNEDLGYSGTGTFTQTGGINAFSNNLFLGYNAGSSGTYSLSGSGLLVSAYYCFGEYVGYSGTGTFMQSGGTNTLGPPLFLGYNAGSSGTYSLSGSGQLCAGDEYVGYFGTGTFTQTGGSSNIADNLYLGCVAGSSGTYNLSRSGLLAAGSEYVGYAPGATAVFRQTGGTNMVSSLSIGNGGSYLLTGGALQVNGGLMNQGIFAGGSTPAVFIVNGILDLSSGTWRNLGDISLSMGASSLLIVPAGPNALTGFANYSTLGLTHTLGTTLTVPAGQGFGGSGSISDPVDCQGTITAAAGGAINLSGGLTLSGTGMVALGSGTLTTNDVTSGISGGSLSVGNHCVGNRGTGTFTQSGGSNIADNLYLGYNAGDSGTYNLSGSGQLSAGGEYVGYSGTGTFTQSGGTNSMDSLSLGSGTYNLSGGLLVLSSLVPCCATAAFNFSGGTLQANGGFSSSLPMTLGTSGGGATFDTAGYVVTLSGSLSGAGSLTKIGSGTLILSGSNSYTGGTMVDAGTLIVTNNEAIADGTSLTVGNAALFAPVIPDLAANSLASSPVPEPSTLVLLTAAVCGAAVYQDVRLRRKKQ